MTNPKVSIIMGIYNCADTLQKAIESILEQTYENWELILCDDGSADNTYAVAESYRALGGYSLAPYVIRCEDIDLWMRFYHAGYHGANLEEYLYYVREDIHTERRRKVRDGFRVAKMLRINYRRFHYPMWQRILACKPIISCLTPRWIKHKLHRKQWGKNLEEMTLAEYEERQGLRELEKERHL